ncbi:MAG: transposase [Firmicutes bacterium]|nr:transposase [Bacillota bacterium]
MKGKNYTKEFKEALLQEVNECNNVAQVARRHELSVKTIYSWRKQSQHKSWQTTKSTAKKINTYTPTAQEFKELESENGQLKELLGKKTLKSLF